MRVTSYVPVVDSGGAGLHRGGTGVEKTYEFLAPASSRSTTTARSRTRGASPAGAPGAVARSGSSSATGASSPCPRRSTTSPCSRRPLRVPDRGRGRLGRPAGAPGRPRRGGRPRPDRSARRARGATTAWSSTRTGRSRDRDRRAARAPARRARRARRVRLGHPPGGRSASTRRPWPDADGADSRQPRVGVEQKADAAELLAQPIGVVRVQRRVVTAEEPLARARRRVRCASPRRSAWAISSSSGATATTTRRE